MKIIYISALLLTLASADAWAQRIDLQSASTLRKHRIELANPSPDNAALKLRKIAGESAFASQKLAFVSLADGYTRLDLEKEGVEVLSVKGKIAIVRLDINDTEQVASLDCVKSLRLERKVNANLDKARADQRIDDILFGKEEAQLPKAYTGKGVITGIVDQGFDAHHINFRYANGESRISYLAWLRANSSGSAMLEDHYNYTNIDKFTTDYSSAYHGTHTLGIMAGSYNGNVTMAQSMESESVATPQYYEVTNPYYGVAPEADIAVSCGDLSDVFIAYGLDYLLGYADFMQYPMVINLSLGSNSGPHDPNSPMAQYLDLVSEDAIVCMAAGNEGDLKIGLTKTLTEEDNTVKTFIYPFAYQYSADDPSSSTVRTGSVEIWSEDDTPFEVKAVIYNKKRGYRAAYNMPVAGEDIGTYYCSSSDYLVTSTDIVGDPTFVKAYTGYVGVGRKVDEDTGRYYGMVDYYVLNNPDTNLEDDYVLGFEVVGQPGKRIDCYCSSSNSWMDSYGVEGFDDGSCNGSISDMAVAKKIIVVGSYNTRNSWPCLNGNTGAFAELKTGEVSPFSSFGTLADGRNLPTICAPGAAVVSSVSWPYAKTLSESVLNASCSAKCVEDNRVNYWKQEVGSSMSTPFVAGSIALWLEANPALTAEEVRDIIVRTAIVDDGVKAGDLVQWGAGKFNALGGLKEAIRTAGMQGVSAEMDNDRLMMTPAGDNTYTVFLGGASHLEINVYALDGSLAMSQMAESDEATLSLSSLQKGFYVISVNGRHSTKILVK